MCKTIKFAVFTLILTFTASIAFAQTPTTLEEWFVLGTEQTERGELQQAIASYTRALQLEPRSTLTFIARGMVYDKINDFNKAIADYTKVIELDPKNVMAYQLRAIDYADLKEHQKAINDATKLIEISLSDPGSYLLRAEFYCNQGLVAKAKEDESMAKALSDEPFVSCEEFRRQTGVSADIQTKLPPANSKTAEDYVKLAQKQARDGYFQDAFESATAAIKLKPAYIEAYEVRAYVYDEVKNYQSAIDDFTKIISLAPNNYLAFLYRGGLYLKLKKYPQAIADLNKIIAMKPADGEGYYLRSRIYCDQGNAVLSKADEQKAAGFGYKIEKYCLANTAQPVPKPSPKPILGNHKTHEQYADFAKRLYGAKDYDGSLRNYTEAIKLKPDSAMYYSQRALVYEAKNNRTEAIQDYTKAISFYEKDFYSYAGRSSLYRQIGRSNEALADISKAIQYSSLDSTQIEYRLRRFDINIALKNNVAASNEINDLIKTYKSYPELYSKRAEFRAKSNNPEGAIDDYTEIIEKYSIQYPVLVEALEKRAAIYKQKGKNAESEADLKMAKSFRSADIYLSSATKFDDAKNYPEALKNYDEAIKLDEANAFLYYRRGLVYKKSGQMQKAVADFEKAILKSNKPIESMSKDFSHTELAQYFYEKREYQTALDHLNIAIVDYATVLNFQIYELRGNVYFSLGKYQKAIDDYRSVKQGLFTILSEEAKANLNTAYCKLNHRECKK